MFSSKTFISFQLKKDMDILDDMGVSKLSAKVFSFNLYESQWVNWLQTLFKISSFVFTRRTKFIQVWYNLRVSIFIFLFNETLSLMGLRFGVFKNWASLAHFLKWPRLQMWVQNLGWFCYLSS